MKKKFYDYAKIKEDITIEQVMVFFDLKGEPDNNGYRTSCPTCGGERSLSLYSARGLFTCHQSGASGSVLDLIRLLGALHLSIGALCAAIPNRRTKLVDHLEHTPNQVGHLM